jgi:hypothetical protein
VKAKVVAFVISVLVLLVSLWLLWDAMKGERVAAAFSRVGGPTRVETAVDASRFWLTPPTSVVTTSANPTPTKASQEIMWGAARCAIALDAPLLFIPRDSRRQRFLEAMIDGWRESTIQESHTPFEELEVRSQGDVAGCLRRENPSNVEGLSTFAVRDRPREFPQIESQTKLASFVVFAAAKGLDDSPDVAVGLALASHLADAKREVSFVIVPRHLEADQELQDQLHKGQELVMGGVVLGQTGIVSEDTRALLRLVITSTDHQGVLEEIRTSLGSLGAAVAAVLALLALGTAAGLAPGLAQRAVERVPAQTEWRVMMNTVRPWQRREEPPRAEPEDLLKEPSDWLKDSGSPLELRLWLRSGWKIPGKLTGKVEGSDSDSQVLELKDATLERDEVRDETTCVRVRLEDVELISEPREQPTNK